MTLPRGIGATYRLQLRPGFGFAAAARVVPYLARLGVETAYLSPVAEAVPGSPHGYDGTDPSSLRAELGGEPGYAALVAACAGAGLGICVDHVPNHLSTWHRGPWWRRLLAEGRGGEAAEVFDVDWDAGPPAARNKVALPLLDRPAGDAIAAGIVRLGHRDRETVLLVGEAGGEAVDLPLARGTDPAPGATEPARGAAEVAEVLAAQHYRLVDWHDARDRNYRRFFDVDALAGVRVEVPQVFDATHALVTDLAARGWISALRVDHVDGLRDPAAYLRRLAGATGVPIVVEKILTGDEPLPRGWPVLGTTGYETMDDVGGVLVDPHGLDRLVALGRAEGDGPVVPLTVETRRLVARERFGAEVARAAQALGVTAGAFREVAVRLPRYRTYLDGAGDASGEDAAELAPWREAEAAAGIEPGAEAGAEAGTEAGAEPGTEAAATGAVTSALADPARRGAAERAQQLTGALMAKGVEDTAWYRLAGPLAFCEVGGDPGRRRHDAVARWHERSGARAAGPGGHGLVPGTTHDTKRAQDVRSRLYALSEMAAGFDAGLAAWRRALGLDGSDELRFETRVAAQLALGMLPPTRPGNGAARVPVVGDAGAADPGSLVARLASALAKGAREAKRRSSWLAPDLAYEARLRDLATSALADDAAVLRSCFGVVVDEAARLGAVASLSATVLRHAVPGLPDCYEGDETWNLSLVDPDNRRAVAFDALARQLGTLDDRLAAVGGAALAEELRRSWRDGRVKHLVTAQCLRARRGPGAAALAPGAPYVALGASGPAAGSVLAFCRTSAADPFGAQHAARRARRASWAVAVVTRLAGRLDADGDDLPAGPSYARTTLALPSGAPRALVDALTGEPVSARGGLLRVDEVLGRLPVALLVTAPGGGAGR